MANKAKIVTHSDSFHADDVFAVASLSILLGRKNIEVVRSRDKGVIEKGDYVVDAGFSYDPDTNRFDHHQKGGAGKRENGIPYASFGLVWKKFGEKISGSKDIADRVDRQLVQPIDAADNGLSVCESTDGLYPYAIQSVMYALRPTFEEKDIDVDDMFEKALDIAVLILGREIIRAKENARAEKTVVRAYESSEDKRIIVLGKDGLEREIVTRILSAYPDVIYAVRHVIKDDVWQVIGITKEGSLYDLRKPLPSEWGGKKDEELAKITGVSDAIFCHNKLFMVVAKSREGAITLAKKALEA